MNDNFIVLMDQDWLDKQRIAGQCVGKILSTINKLILEHPANLSLLDLEALTDSIFKEYNCTATFFNYKGFPGKLCLSVNKELVHGIPKSYTLQDGDVVKFDVGATYEGAIADAAVTAIYGQPKSAIHSDLVKICKESLDEAIKMVKVGKQLGCIGNAIHKYVTKKSRFSIVTDYGGHAIGLNNTPHADPFVANVSQPNVGPRLVPGMTLAIEPLLVVGPSSQTKVDKDGWTVLTKDISSHFEHTIFIHEKEVEIITKWE